MRSTHRPGTITVSGVTEPLHPAGQQHNPPTGYQDPSTGWQQPAFYLNNLAPPQPHKHGLPTWAILTIIGSIAVVIFAAYFIAALPEEGPESPPGIGTPAPYDEAAGKAAPPTTPDGDPAGKRACEAVQLANKGNITTHDPAAMNRIAADGKQSTDSTIRATAVLLGRAADRARAAVGADDETARRLDLGTAALNLETECLYARLIRPT